MRAFWDSIFRLDEERSICVEREELGTEKSIFVGNKQYLVRIPSHLKKHKVLRLKGLGKTRRGKKGDLFLHVWLNRGEDSQQSLWVSETLARNGTEKIFLLGERKISLTIPRGSRNGSTIRLNGLGKAPIVPPSAPLFYPQRGDLYVKLITFPDQITPMYGSFDALTTEEMALEGWVYRRMDQVIRRMGKHAFLGDPIGADAVADLFNQRGWAGISRALVEHLGLAPLDIQCKMSNSIALPGCCQRTSTGAGNPPVYHYVITLNARFLDNPFSVAAILAHELCHVVYTEKIDDQPKPVQHSFVTENASVEEERTVDLLVFMFKLGEFQLRVARDTRLTFGYFNQPVFERMQVFVAKQFQSM